MHDPVTFSGTRRCSRWGQSKAEHTRSATLGILVLLALLVGIAMTLFFGFIAVQGDFDNNLGCYMVIIGLLLVLGSLISILYY